MGEKGVVPPGPLGRGGRQNAKRLILLIATLKQRIFFLKHLVNLPHFPSRTNYSRDNGHKCATQKHCNRWHACQQLRKHDCHRNGKRHGFATLNVVRVPLLRRAASVCERFALAKSLRVAHTARKDPRDGFHFLNPARDSKKNEDPDLNQEPIGLQPTALPIELSPQPPQPLESNQGPRPHGHVLPIHHNNGRAVGNF